MSSGPITKISPEHHYTMMTRNFYTFLLLGVFTVTTVKSQRSVESAFKSAGIVRDVLDRAPSGFIEVRIILMLVITFYQ